MNAPVDLNLNSSKASLQRILDAQKAAHLRHSGSTAERRIEWLDRCIGLLVDHQAEIGRPERAISARARRTPRA